MVNIMWWYKILVFTNLPHGKFLMTNDDKSPVLSIQKSINEN